MRLKEFQVKQICQKVLLTLRSKQLIVLKRKEAEVLAKMEEIFIADLKVEDDLNREAEKILAKYEAEMGDKIDRHKMLTMIKRQLVKDRNLVI